MRALPMAGREAARAHRAARHFSWGLGMERVGLKKSGRGAFYWFHVLGIYFRNAARCKW